MKDQEREREREGEREREVNIDEVTKSVLLENNYISVLLKLLKQSLLNEKVAPGEHITMLGIYLP